MGSTGLPMSDRDRIEQLERRLAVLEKATSLTSASVGSGGVRVHDGGSITLEDGGSLTVDDGGNIILAGGAMGVFPPPGTGGGFAVGTGVPLDCPGGIPQLIFVIERNDGSIALELLDRACPSDYANLSQALVWRDRMNHNIISDDTDGKNGIARPYIPPFQWRRILTPSFEMITSGTFSQVEWGVGYRQHPRMAGAVIVYSSASDTEGEWQITKGSDVLYGPRQIAGSEYGIQYILPSIWGGTPWTYDADMAGEGANSPQVVALEVRRTSGSGNIAAGMLGLFGVQS